MTTKKEDKTKKEKKPLKEKEEVKEKKIPLKKEEDSEGEKEPEIIKEKDIVDEEEVSEPEKVLEKTKKVVEMSSWNPKTELGKKVKAGEITDIDQALNYGKPILESEIIDVLIPDIEKDLLLIGQSRGKFGGGQRRVFKQTQKKTREGNKPQFATFAIVGNRDGYVGVGYGKAKETVPAREKAISNAKLNLIKIKRGCGSWECNCGNPHTVPFEVAGKNGSVTIRLLSAPVGKGLIVESECQKVMELAGIKDVWSKTTGKTKTKNNLIIACFKALKKLSETKITDKQIKELNIIEGKGTLKED